VSIYQTDIAGFARHYGLNVAYSSLRKIVGKIHSNTNLTLAPSTSACKELESLGVNNVALWRRGVNTILFHPKAKSDDLRASWGAPHKTIIGYVGRLANEKRISDLKVLDSDSSIQLVIVGEGPARSKLERELPHAIFAGFQSGDALARHYASFDLFIHPGPNETFCQAVQEALASGVPSIVPKTGGPADLVSHGETGYVIDTSNSEELVAAVNNFRKRSDVPKMKALCRKTVQERTWDFVNSQLMNHYDSVLSHSGNQREGSAA
jgi:phosphatidylinositol alpha 1,6-mannosyltransferase